MQAEADEQRGAPIRHVDDVPNGGKRPVESRHEPELLLEIVANRVDHALAEILRLGGRVEIAVQVVRFVLDDDLLLAAPVPSDEFEEGPRECLQDLVIAAPVAQDGG